MPVLFLIVGAFALAYVLLEWVTPLGNQFLWWSTATAALGFGIWAVLEALILSGVFGSSGEESG